jgi:hypothetical protein
MKLNTLKSLSFDTGSTESPPLESEPLHQRLARLTREQERVTEALRELKRAWAERNIKAQATRTPIPTAEMTHVENRRREFAGELLQIQTQIGAVNREIRERKAEHSEGNSRGTPLVKNGTKRKACPLKEHPSYDQYFRLAAENELEAGLYRRIEAAAKSMLSHALKTGVEES